MKSIELFIAPGLATTMGLSTAGSVSASESDLALEEANDINTYLISGDHEGGEG